MTLVRLPVLEKPQLHAAGAADMLTETRGAIVCRHDLGLDR